MARSTSASKALLLILLVNLILVMDRDNTQVEAIFFLDLLCAHRINALEQRVSELVALQQNASRNNNNNNIASTSNNVRATNTNTNSNENNSIQGQSDPTMFLPIFSSMVVVVFFLLLPAIYIM